MSALKDPTTLLGVSLTIEGDGPWQPVHWNLQWRRPSDWKLISPPLSLAVSLGGALISDGASHG